MTDTSIPGKLREAILRINGTDKAGNRWAPATI